MRPTTSYIQSALLREIADQAGLAIFDREKPIVVVEQILSTDWASATFDGATHQFDLQLRGNAGPVDAALQRIMSGLAEREVAIPGHIVAEIAVAAGDLCIIDDIMITQSLTVNVLTITD